MDKMDILTLDIQGVALAFVIALVMLYFGSATYLGPRLGLYYVFVMLYFLALSAVATRSGEEYKRKAKLYQVTRGVKNVLANGMGPLLFTIAVWYAARYLTNSVTTMLIYGFIASVAAVTADKFSSEIGVLNGTPTSIITLGKIKKGTSGGITLLGLFAGTIGALLIVIIALFTYIYLFPNLACSLAKGCALSLKTLVAIIAMAIGGFAGTVADSYFGVFEERGIGNKYTSNFLCSIIGGCAGIVAFVLL